MQQMTHANAMRAFLYMSNTFTLVDQKNNKYNRQNTIKQSSIQCLQNGYLKCPGHPERL